MTEQKPPNVREQDLFNQQQREIFLVRLWEKGLDTSDCIAYHETSLEAIQILIFSGALPGYTGEIKNNPKRPQLGDVYFTPRLGFFPFEEVPDIQRLFNGSPLHPGRYEELLLDGTKAIRIDRGKTCRSS